MRQCSIADIKPGMVLGQPLHAYYGGKRTLLLGAKAAFSAPLITKLQSMGYSFVYIEEEGTEEIVPENVLSDETWDNALQAVSRYYEKICSYIKELSKKRDRKSVDIMEMGMLSFPLPKSSLLRESVRDIIEDLFIIGKVEGYDTISGVSRTNAIHNHVLNVTVISLLIGSEYGFVDSEQNVLGMGALLHDVGKTVLPGIYEKRYWELDPDDQEEVQKHPLLGERLLSEARSISEAERQIIVQHHERQDGNGYPFGLKGKNNKPLRSPYHEANRIFRFAEIVAVANVFDNLVSGNYFQHRFTPEEALKELNREAGTGLNSDIVRVLSNLVTLYPVGSNVVIKRHSDANLMGAQGVVAKSDTKDSREIEIILLYDGNGKRMQPYVEKVHLVDDKSIKLSIAY